MESTSKKIALLGDIHANLPALEAVLAHAKNLKVEEFWNIGDFLGYGAFPNQVINRMQKENSRNIIGNYDLKVLNFHKKGDKWQQNKHPMKYLAFKWANDALSTKNRKFLGSLPDELEIKIGKYKFLLVHGSPASNEELIEPNTPDSRLLELNLLAQETHGVDFSAIICGHSHQAFTRRVEKTLFINTGSVGRPDDGNPRTAYAILQVSENGLQVSHYRLNYDVSKAVAAIRNKGLPEAFAQMLIHGRDLETILKN